MKTELVREHQEKIDAAYDHLNESTFALVCGISQFAKHEQSIGPLVRLDDAIRHATKALVILRTLASIRDESITVNLTERDDAGIIEKDMASESPAVRSLPETEHIKPIARRHQPLRSLQAAS